ncbi:unannotated protein [freshwater metagenome]|uniref:Unannotated protein n=1 Tax=freshwater metagenome TaxID=449393 RepID=A0A6J6RDV4_9ZZZZ
MTERQVTERQVREQKRAACDPRIPNLVAPSDLLHEGRRVLEQDPVRVAARQSKRDS